MAIHAWRQGLDLERWRRELPGQAVKAAEERVERAADALPIGGTGPARIAFRPMLRVSGSRWPGGCGTRLGSIRWPSPRVGARKSK